jgi:hypothetical protein
MTLNFPISRVPVPVPKYAVTALKDVGRIYVGGYFKYILILHVESLHDLRRILLSTSLLFYVLLIWGRHHSR